MSTATPYTLPRTSPEQQGIRSSTVLELVNSLDQQIQDVHSFMLLRHGVVVAEGWWSPYERENPRMLYSLSKSFTSTAVGIAIAEGFFSIEDPVLPFFFDDAPAEVNAHLAAMRVRHLLSMTTGHADDTWWHMEHRADGNWIKAFFGVPVLHEPGTHFLYNTGATYMLSAIVQKTTGLKVVDFLQPRLFEPLGILNARWEESPQGINLGGIGLYLKTEAIAHFGQLYLQKGMWQGKRLIPEAWVEEATAFQVANGDMPYSDWTQGYGYQFWRCRHNAYRGDGAFGQYCVVMPEQDAVLAITGGMALEDMQQPLDLLWDLLPAMGSEPLAEETEAQQALTDKLTNLNLSLLQGQAAPTLAAAISGQTYNIDSNDLGINTISLNFSESGCVLNINRAADQQSIACGYKTWERSQTSVFNEPAMIGLSPVATNGAWVSQDCFTAIVRLYETPFFYTLVFHFDDDEMLIESGVNLSLESQQRHLLTAYKLP